MNLESQLIDSLIEGFFLFDTEAHLVRINPSGERILGRSRKSVAGKSAGEIFENNTELAEMVHSSIDGNRAVVLSGVILQDTENRKINLSVSVSPVQMPDGTIVGATLLARDETLHREVDRAYRRADQLATFGVLNMGMAHEIKNPLGGIKGATQLLASEINPESPMMEYCEVILREVERIDGLLETLLAAVPRETPRETEINIHEVIDEVIGLLELSEETTDLTFKRVYDPSLPYIPGDRNGLLQVFLNLLKNAVEASDKGEEITVRTHVPVGGPVGPPGTTRGGVLEIAVEDQGQGFNPDIRDFSTPFVTTKPKGVGLGLAISEQIIQNHGGSLVLDNKESGGAAVRVFLPLTSV